METQSSVFSKFKTFSLSLPKRFRRRRDGKMKWTGTGTAAWMLLPASSPRLQHLFRKKRGEGLNRGTSLRNQGLPRRGGRSGPPEGWQSGDHGTSFLPGADTSPIYNSVLLHVKSTTENSAGLDVESSFQDLWARKLHPAPARALDWGPENWGSCLGSRSVADGLHLLCKFCS